MPVNSGFENSPFFQKVYQYTSVAKNDNFMEVNMLEKLLELLWYVEDFFEDLILLLATPFMYIFTFIQTMWEYRNNPDPEYWERKVEEDQKEIARLTRELNDWEKNSFEKKDIQNALYSTTLNIQNMRKNMLSYFDCEDDSEQVQKAFNNSKTAVEICLNALDRYGVVLPNQEEMERIRKMDIQEFDSPEEVNLFFSKIISDISNFMNN